MPRAKRKVEKKTESVKLNIAHWDDVIYQVQHRVAYCEADVFCGFMEKVYERKMKPEDLGAACCAWEHDDAEDTDVVQYWFNSGRKISLAPSIIVHEIVHGVDFVFSTRHVPPGFKSTEARAYYTAGLVKVLPHLLDNLGAKMLGVGND